MKALSIMQPWAWLIVNGHKDIENRTWPTKHRGMILIHAGKTIDGDAADDLKCGKNPVTGLPHDFGLSLYGCTKHETGGIVGAAEIVDCVTASGSPWFVGPYGFVLRNAKPLPFRPMRGRLGLFDATGESAP